MGCSTFRCACVHYESLLTDFCCESHKQPVQKNQNKETLYSKRNFRDAWACCIQEVSNKQIPKLHRSVQRVEVFIRKFRLDNAGNGFNGRPRTVDDQHALSTIAVVERSDSLNLLGVNSARIYIYLVYVFAGFSLFETLHLSSSLLTAQYAQWHLSGLLLTMSVEFGESLIQRFSF